MLKIFSIIALTACLSLSASYTGISFYHTADEQTRNQVATETKHDYLQENAWGLHTTVDLDGCDAELIQDKEYVEQCFVQLCDVIKMKRFGNPWVVHFGECESVAGFTGVQLIETSDITCHLANASLKGYFDVFSCKWYDPFVVADFLQKYFKASGYRITIIQRI